MRTEALTLQQLIALSDKEIWAKAKKRASQYKSLDNMRKLTKDENIAYNRVQSIVKLYEITFSEDKACK